MTSEGTKRGTRSDIGGVPISGSEARSCGCGQLTISGIYRGQAIVCLVCGETPRTRLGRRRLGTSSGAPTASPGPRDQEPAEFQAIRFVVALEDERKRAEAAGEVPSISRAVQALQMEDDAS